MTPGELARAMPRTGPWGGFSSEQKRQLMGMVWERRLAAWSWSMISRDLGITTSYAQTLAKEYVAEVVDKDREVARAEERERLDALERSLLEQFASTRDPKLIDAIMRITDRRARMLGLDEPVKTDSTVTVQDPMDRELSEVLAEAAAAEAAARERQG